MYHHDNNHHTYGPTCYLSEGPPPSNPDESSSEDPPIARAQFFYTSPLAIDDPLSPLPTPGKVSDTAPKHPPRPFSAFDNTALEEAWQGLQKRPRGHKQKRAKKSRLDESPLSERPHGIESHDGAVDRMRARHARVSEEEDEDAPGHHTEGRSNDHGEDESHHHNSRKSDKSRSHHNEDTIEEETSDHEIQKHRPHRWTHRLSDRRDRDSDSDRASPGPHSAHHRGLDESFGHGSPSKSPNESHSPLGQLSSDKDTTGTPFVRAPPSRIEEVFNFRKHAHRRHGSDSGDNSSGEENGEDQRGRHGSTRPSSQSSHRARLHHTIEESYADSRSRSQRRSVSRSGTISRSNKTRSGKKAYIPVGVSRLYLVEMQLQPSIMEMKPIYWRPVNDVCSVIRGTWFFKDTLLPVEAEVANQLEAGYLELKPWTETWQDELNSALEVGAEGEAKVVHPLWPEDLFRKEGGHDSEIDRKTEELLQAGNEGVLVAAGSTKLPSGTKVGNSAGGSEPPKPFADTGVLYFNSAEAFLLRPSQLPSAYHRRRPLHTIKKGKTVGIPVIRGFSRHSWEKHHPPKKGKAVTRAHHGATASQSAVSADSTSSCPACAAQSQPTQATDLILVIHGIGQKLSERIESYNFTHAINGLRREVFLELGTEDTKAYLRKGFKGLMVLPVNWRSTLSFEDGGFPGEGDEVDSANNRFTLKDITPDSIPAVRNLISDVMLDIPYYLSHHKAKMVEAVIREANRVYRLWCRNNPGFQDNGRVHLVAHSLGSCLALDILSKQPTHLPKHINLESRRINNSMFEFDTRNLFFAGSPAGFFLLLNRAALLPRRGRNKPGAEGLDAGRGVAGEAGQYGCLAIDNIYNVYSYNDPIAYRLNATVDTDYAAYLKAASVPSRSAGFFQSIGNAFRSGSVGSNTDLIPGVADPERPNTTRLPSNIELETHNFTREELAEKRMLLLNETGQIDWFLAAGKGPLDIQYLNMLSAHSAYWTSQDFAKFLVLEVGRTPGRKYTAPNMRPVKKPHPK